MAPLRWAAAREETGPLSLALTIYARHLRRLDLALTSAPQRQRRCQRPFCHDSYWTGPGGERFLPCRRRLDEMHGSR